MHGSGIGCYEHNEVKPSIEMATLIAQALNVSLDYLVGSTDLLLDNNIIKKIQEFQQLDTENKKHLFALMDAFLRDYKAKQAYSI
ncbi:MAG: helix-turn-helix domain-containing protein [Bacteroidota bacterium]